MPIVRLVTLADTNTPSVRAFVDELLTVFGFGFNGLDYRAYSAVIEGSTLAAARKAVADDPHVIVAGGADAVTALVGLTGVIPIVMVGGAAPNPPPRNLTGFLINQLAIAQAHVTSLLQAAHRIAVLYDDTPHTLSLATYQAITTPGPTPYIPTDRLVSLPAKTIAEIKASNLGGADGFMLIPNATYYQYSQDVASLVDGNVATIYYPEREYKRAHSNTGGVHVHGHSIPLAFRRAAWYAERITTGDWGVGTLPALTEAHADEP